MRTETLRTEIVEYIPDKTEEGVLYVSPRFSLTIHKCACGCGIETPLPIGAQDWTLTIDGDLATLHPSIGQRTACRSHYWIQGGKVVWA